jgi:MbtH protein
METATNTTAAPEPTFRVVVNEEGQHSIWPADREAPRGWSDAGCAGPKGECLSFVDAHWKDMRPASLRAAMAGPA